MAAPDDVPATAIVLVPPRGAQVPGTARWKVTPAWLRQLRSGAVLVVGAALAVPAVALPPHFVVSAGVLGLAAIAARALWERGVFVRDIVFTCACGAPVALPEAMVWTDDTWVRCPACAAPWRVGPPPVG